MGDLQKQVNIEFLDDEDVIKIEGPPTNADQAREILEKQVKELMTKMSGNQFHTNKMFHLL